MLDHTCSGCANLTNLVQSDCRSGLHVMLSRYQAHVWHRASCADPMERGLVSAGYWRLLLVLLAAAAAMPQVQLAALPAHRQLPAVGEDDGEALWHGASSSGSSGGEAYSHRALRADRCIGCDAGQCFPATGCASCDSVAGYHPDGAGGCTQGATLHHTTCHVLLQTSSCEAGVSATKSVSSSCITKRTSAQCASGVVAHGVDCRSLCRQVSNTAGEPWWRQCTHCCSYTTQIPPSLRGLRGECSRHRSAEKVFMQYRASQISRSAHSETIVSVRTC